MKLGSAYLIVTTISIILSYGMNLFINSQSSSNLDNWSQNCYSRT